MRILVSGYSDKGTYRLTNQDSLYLNQKQVEGKTVCLGVVCDGVGSFKNGEVAAALVTQTMKQWMDVVLPTYISEGLGFDAIQGLLNERLIEVNHTISKYKLKYAIKTGTTVSVILIIDQKYMIAHIGDSRVYRINRRGKKCKLLTLDHTTVHNGKLFLTQCVGNNQGIEIFNTVGRVQVGDTFLICSDGFYKWLNLEKIVYYSRYFLNQRLLNYFTKKLVLSVKNGQNKDNISLGIIRIKETQ